MKCQCHHPRRVFSTVKTAPGLGFTIDWSGLATNAIKAIGSVSIARNTLRIQQAQQAAALRAQETEFQLMQRRQAQTVAQPVSGLVTTPHGQVMQIMPNGGMAPVVQYAPRPALPSWAIPAAVGFGVLFLMRK